MPRSTSRHRARPDTAESDRQGSKAIELFQLVFLEAARPELPPEEHALKGEVCEGRRTFHVPRPHAKHLLPVYVLRAVRVIAEED
jgi:hypothetical protein